MEWKNKPMKWKNEGTPPSPDLVDMGFMGGYKPPASVFNHFFSTHQKLLDEVQENVDLLQAETQTETADIRNTIQANVDELKATIGSNTEAFEAALEEQLTNVTADIESKYNELNTGKADKTQTEASINAINDNINTINTNMDTKVDKVEGKGLSTNDFTNADKAKTNLVKTDLASDVFLAGDGTYKEIDVSVETLANKLDKTIGGTVTGAVNFTGGLKKNGAEIPTLDSTGKIPYSNIPTGTTGTTVSTGNHTHNYAGSSSAGGAANVATSLQVRDIVANTDLNSLTSPGFYRCQSNATVATLTNCPTGGNAFFLIVGLHAGYFQELTEYITGVPRCFRRNSYGGTWGAWYRIYTTVDKPTPNELGLPLFKTYALSTTDSTKLHSQIVKDNWNNTIQTGCFLAYVNRAGNAAYVVGCKTSNLYGEFYVHGYSIPTPEWHVLVNGVWSVRQHLPLINGKVPTNITCEGNVETKGKLLIKDSDDSYSCASISSSKNSFDIYSSPYGHAPATIFAPSLRAQDLLTGEFANMIAGGFMNMSSRRFKENIKDIPLDEANKIYEINPVKFDYIKGEKNAAGVIAEEVEPLFPNVCSYSKDNPEDEEEQLFGVDYSKFVPYLIKVVQEQKKEIDEMRAEIAILNKN